MSGPIPSFPLAWPKAYPRARIRHATTNNLSFQQCRWDVLGELMRFHARDIVLSTNLHVDAQNEPIYDHEPHDPGVAIWFRILKKSPTGDRLEQMAIACDRWTTVHLNLGALAATMMGLRGMYRFGTTHVLDSMIAGLAVPLVMEISTPEDYEFEDLHGGDLDGPTARWWHVLGFQHPAEASLEEAEKRYRAHVKQAHPDRGGTDEAMRIFNEAIAQARDHFAPRGEHP